LDEGLVLLLDVVQKVSSIAVDSDNNVYITGSFCSQTLVFDTIVLHSNVYQDIFLVKYDPSGNLIWAKSFGDFWL
jgi:hypothetical protein